MRAYPSIFIVGAVAALLTVGCEKGQLTAPADSEIVVGAAQSTLNIDPNRLQTEASTAITAQVFKDNLPQEGVVVFFQTNGGHLASCVPVDPADLSKGCTQQGIKTDAQGAARDILTVRIDEEDPEPIKVTAVSGAVTGSTEIRKIIGTPNRPPIPAVIVAPREQQAVGKPVVFDGSASTDPDDDPITCWRWTLSSSNPDDDKPNPYVIQGSAVNAFDVTFAKVQDLAGSLQLTDDPTARSACDSGGRVVFEATAPIRYTIVRVLCADNQAPIATIAGPDTILLSGGFNTTINLLLDGSLSSDPEQLAMDDYVWNCGNSYVAQEQGDGSKAVCQYRVEGSAITYTATLVVKDRGTGDIDPQTGTYTCQKSSAEASVKITVSPTAPPQ